MFLLLKSVVVVVNMFWAKYRGRSNINFGSTWAEVICFIFDCLYLWKPFRRAGLIQAPCFKKSFVTKLFKKEKLGSDN